MEFEGAGVDMIDWDGNKVGEGVMEWIGSIDGVMKLLDASNMVGDIARDGVGVISEHV